MPHLTSSLWFCLTAICALAIPSAVDAEPEKGAKTAAVDVVQHVVEIPVIDDALGGAVTTARVQVNVHPDGTVSAERRGSALGDFLIDEARQGRGVYRQPVHFTELRGRLRPDGSFALGPAHEVDRFGAAGIDDGQRVDRRGPFKETGTSSGMEIAGHVTREGVVVTGYSMARDEVNPYSGKRGNRSPLHRERIAARATPTPVGPDPGAAVPAHTRRARTSGRAAPAPDQRAAAPERGAAAPAPQDRGVLLPGLEGRTAARARSDAAVRSQSAGRSWGGGAPSGHRAGSGGSRGGVILPSLAGRRSR